MGGEIQVLSVTQLATVGDALANFFLPEKVGEALKQADWTVLEEIKVLTEMVRNDDLVSTRQGDMKPVVSFKEKLVAMNMLRKLVKDALVTSGAIESVKGHAERTLSDGTKLTMDAESTRMAAEGSRRVMSSLDLLNENSGPETIEAEIINVEPISHRLGRGTGGGAITGSDEHGGSGTLPSVYGVKRADGSPSPETTEGDDKEPTGGAEDERSTGIPKQSGRSGESKESGEADGPDSEHVANLGGAVYAPAESTAAATDPGRHPFVPGSSNLRATTSRPGPTLNALAEAFGNPKQREAGPDRPVQVRQLGPDAAVGPDDELPADPPDGDGGCGCGC